MTDAADVTWPPLDLKDARWIGVTIWDETTGKSIDLALDPGETEMAISWDGSGLFQLEVPD